MSVTAQIAKHFRDVHFGGNWTFSNLKDNLADVNWQQATTRVYSFNTIATLVYHMNYYVSAVTKVLQGEPLNASDKFSFDHPAVNSQEDWDTLLEKHGPMPKTLPILLSSYRKQNFGKTFRMASTAIITGIFMESSNTVITI